MLECSLFKILHLLTILRTQFSNYIENKSTDPKAHISYHFQTYVTVCLLYVEFKILMKLFNFPLFHSLLFYKILSFFRGIKKERTLKLNKMSAHFVPRIMVSALCYCS